MCDKHMTGKDIQEVKWHNTSALLTINPVSQQVFTKWSLTHTHTNTHILPDLTKTTEEFDQSCTYRSNWCSERLHCRNQDAEWWRWWRSFRGCSSLALHWTGTCCHEIKRSNSNYTLVSQWSGKNFKLLRNWGNHPRHWFNTSLFPCLPKGFMQRWTYPLLFCFKLLLTPDTFALEHQYHYCCCCSYVEG